MKHVLRLLFLSALALNALADGPGLASKLACFATQYGAKCNAQGECGGPPPMPLMPIGSVDLVVTHGNGYDEAKAELVHIFALGNRKINFTANGHYYVNADRSQYLPGIAEQFEDQDSGLTVSTNGPVQGTQTSLSAHWKTPREADGSYIHFHVFAFCSLQ